jgi:hypothetical protein
VLQSFGGDASLAEASSPRCPVPRASPRGLSTALGTVNQLPACCARAFQADQGLPSGWRAYGEPPRSWRH